jgi:hypothetical protein
MTRHDTEFAKTIFSRPLGNIGGDEACVCIALGGSLSRQARWAAWRWRRVTGRPQATRRAPGASAKDYYAALHRVAYYGDHTRSIRQLAHLMGLKVVEEG